MTSASDFSGPRWFDTHVHLERYAETERSVLLQHAAAAGVARLLAVSSDLASSRRTGALALPVLKCVGVHPLRAAEGVTDELDKLAATPDVVAIGETGFDADGPDVAVQAGAFRDQCRVARACDLAVVLHLDGLWDAFAGEADALDGLRVVRHYFLGDCDQARWHAERGHFVSFGRPLLRSAELQQIARRLPPELLLIETDSYPLPGRTTEPRDVPSVGTALAPLRGWSDAECAARLWANGCAAFALPEA